MSRQGMTLMEVVVVLAILGIGVVVVVPAVQEIRAVSPVERSSQQLQSLLQGARRTAAERSVAVTVTIDPASGRYWINAGPGDSIRSGVLALGPGMSLAGGQFRVRFAFDPTGPASGDPLALEGHGVRLPLQVDRWSGEIAVGR